jgi:2',3'-cyclic-nucleotide 2'-phosphodiesterase (5'-nucleotidase family)
MLLLALNQSVSANEKATLVFAGEMTEIATDKKGGYPELETALKLERKNPTPTFFLFGGGSLGPSTLSSLDRGTHIIDLLNSLEPHAMGVSKREFSFSEDELSLRSYEAAFPLVSSNVVDTLTQVNLDGLVSSAVVQQGPYKLGILSILDQSTIEDYALTRIKISDPKQSILKEAKKLRSKGVDLVILLYSNYYEELSNLLTNNIIDLSLRKDEHFEFEDAFHYKHHPKDIILGKPGQIAILRLEWLKGDANSLKVEWKAKNLSQYAKDPKVLRQVINYTDRLANLMRQQIGVLNTDMDTSLLKVRSQQNAFANFITDSLRKYTHAEVALINGGTIRGEKHYKANTSLTRKDISRELPFRNKAVLLKVTGKQIIAALENGFSLFKTAKGRFPQVSGMEIVFNSNNKVGNRVVSVKINGKTVESEKTYTLATTDYLASGGDGFTMFKNADKLIYNNQMSRLLSDIVIDSIKSQNRISVKLDSRLINIGEQLSVNSNVK